MSDSDWMQSARVEAGTPDPSVWMAPPMPPEYHDAVSEAWHQAFARNNPGAYQQAYAPNADVAAASEAAAAHLRRPDLPGIAYGAQPDVRASRDVLMQGAGQSIAAFHPLAVAGNALDLMSTPVASGERSAAEQRADQLHDLETKINELQQKRDAAASSVPYKPVKSTDQNGGVIWKRMQDPAALSTKTAPFDADLTDYRNQRNGLLSSQAQELSSKAASERPFAETAPAWLKNTLMAAPAVSAGLSLPIAAMIGKPAAYVANGLGGAVEGFIGGFGPTFSDLHLPEGSPGRMAAQRRLSDPSFWATEVAPEVGMSTATALLGTNYGLKGRAAVDAMRSGASAKNALAGTASSPSQAFTRPKAAYIDASGREVHLGANGHPMFENKAGVWQHVRGQIAASKDRPPWIGMVGGNALDQP